MCSGCPFAGGVEDLEGLRQSLGLGRIQMLGHSAGAYLGALYAAEHPATTAGVCCSTRGHRWRRGLWSSSGRARSSRRTPGDDDARKAIEESEEFRTGRPQALERHHLNNLIPFFKERATAERVSLGFTEITAANVQQAPKRMMGSLMGVHHPGFGQSGVRVRRWVSTSAAWSVRSTPRSCPCR